MKKLLTLLLLLLVFSCKSTSSKADLASARVTYQSNEGRNTVTLLSQDHGDTDDSAVFNAKKLAFQNLFFRGISGSPFNDPLIGIDEREAFNTHKVYLNDFYSNRMESFIISATENVEKIKGGERLAKVNLKVILRALRTDLEEKEIIKKFGL